MAEILPTLDVAELSLRAGRSDNAEFLHVTLLAIAPRPSTSRRAVKLEASAQHRRRASRRKPPHWRAASEAVEANGQSSRFGEMLSIAAPPRSLAAQELSVAPARRHSDRRRALLQTLHAVFQFSRPREIVLNQALIGHCKASSCVD